MTIVCVRHGETEWSRTNRHTGRQDIELTDAGRAQARSAAERLSGREWALVLSSPLGRALETARLAGFPDPELDDDLMEWDYGTAEGRTADDLRAETPGWTLWAAGPAGGETLADLAARADRVCDRVAAVEGDVLLFAHGHVLRVLAARWLEQPAAFAERLQLGTAAICELEARRGVRVLTRWNT